MNQFRPTRIVDPQRTTAVTSEVPSGRADLFLRVLRVLYPRPEGSDVLRAG
jgi:hypothetical protein